MSKSNGFYPRVRVAVSESGAVSQAGSVVLTETVRTVGLDRELSSALGPWRKRLAVHDPGKVLIDLALTLAVGGGLPGRHRGPACRAWRVRAGRVGPDRVTHHQRPGR